MPDARLLPCVLFLCVCICFESKGQNIDYKIESQAIATTRDVLPFWFRSNQYGSIPDAGLSMSFLAEAQKKYNTESADTWYGKEKLFDWGAGFSARINASKESDIRLIEGYGKVRLAMFELKLGRTRDVMGLNGDTTLSSGNFAVSGNALGIPKLEIAIPEYWTIPGLDGLIAIKGNFAHGWVGRIPVDTINYDRAGIPTHSLITPKTYLHQKSFYGRFGKPTWRINLFGGFNHQVFWGNEKDIFRHLYTISQFQTFLKVISGTTLRLENIPNSKVGNQIGSIDLGFDYSFRDVKITLYRQNFYDVGALASLANIRDGLNGIHLENKIFNRNATERLQWQAILFEFFYSKHQAGEFGSKSTKSGDEDYYNNYYYMQGWSYKGLGIGSPLISTKSSARSGFAHFPKDYFINNRIIALHAGIKGSYQGFDFKLKGMYSWNYGTFGTSPEGHSGPTIDRGASHGLFGMVNQLSLFIESSRTLGNGLQIGGALAIDQGDLLYNSIGGLLKVSKRF